MDESLINDVAFWLRDTTELRTAILELDDATVLYHCVAALASVVQRSDGRVDPYRMSFELAGRILDEAIHWEQLLRLVKEQKSAL